MPHVRISGFRLADPRAIAILLAFGILVAVSASIGVTPALLLWGGLVGAVLVIGFPRLAFFLVLLVTPLDFHLKSDFVLSAILDPARLLVAVSILVRPSLKREAVDGKAIALIAAYAASVAASLVYAQLNHSLGVPYDSLRFAYQLASYVAFGLAATRVLRRRDDLMTGFWILCIGLVATSIYAIYQAGVHDYGPIYRWLYPLSANLPWLDRPPGLLQHPNNQSAYINLVLPIIVSVGLLVRRASVRVVALLTFGVSVASLFLTQSRGSWVAFVVIFAILCLRRSPPLLRFPTAAIAALITAGVIFLVPAIALRIQEFDASLYSRLDLWAIFSSLFFANPVFGVGYGSFGIHYAEATHITLVPGTAVLHAHDVYLQLLAETGIVGCVAFLATVFRTILAAWRLHCLAEGRDPLVAGFFCGVALGLTGFLVHGLVDVVWYSAQFATLFWLLLFVTASWRGTLGVIHTADSDEFLSAAPRRQALEAMRQ